MRELDRLKTLLDDLLIAWEPIGGTTVALSTKSVFVNAHRDGLSVVGWGYSGQFRYSAEYVARMLDRKFREEMRMKL